MADPRWTKDYLGRINDTEDVNFPCYRYTNYTAVENERYIDYVGSVEANIVIPARTLLHVSLDDAWMPSDYEAEYYDADISEGTSRTQKIKRRYYLQIYSYYSSQKEF